MKKELTIIAQSNGIGKSTIAKKLLEYDSGLGFVNSDYITFNLSADNIQYVRVTASKVAIKNIYYSIKIGLSFIWDVILSSNFTEKIIIKANENVYFLKLICAFLYSYFACITWIKIRVMKGRHSIPDKDVIRKYKRSKENFFKYKDLVDFWELNSNSDTIKIIAEKDNIIDLEKYSEFFGVENG